MVIKSFVIIVGFLVLVMGGAWWYTQKNDSFSDPPLLSHSDSQFSSGASVDEPPFKDELIFIPVNWNPAKDDFLTLVSESVSEFKREYLEVNEKVFPLLENDERYFQSQFEITTLSNCIDICRFDQQPNLLNLERVCVNQCQEKQTGDPHPTYVALTNDESYEDGNYQEYTSVIVNVTSSKDVSSVVHEIGHLFWALCDEYEYSVWKKQDEDNKANREGKGCPNPYPPICADHPEWAGKKENYRAYIKSVGVSWNGYEHLLEREEPELCTGAVCPASPGFAACRSVMGPAIHPDDINYYFGGKLEHKIPYEALQQ